MTIKELIKELKKCKNQDAPVYVWCSENAYKDESYWVCHRYPVVHIDDDFDNHRCIDLDINKDYDWR